MNNFDFFFLFYNQQLLFWFSFAICVTLFLLLYKPYIINVLDPLLFSAIITSFGASVVVFMYFTGSIKLFYLASYFLTQLAFILGIYLFKPFNSIKNTYQIKTLTIANSDYLLKLFFIVNSIIFILLQLQVYLVAGIPIFASSRLDTFSGGSGFGLLSRFIDVTQIFSNTILFYIIINKEIKSGLLFKIYLCFFAVSLVLFAILNGSKSGILTVLYTAFTAWVFSFDISINKIVTSFIKKYKIAIFSFVVLIGLTVVLLQTDSTLNLNPFEILGTRFIFAGDVYWYAYPNDIIIGFYKYNGIKALFTDFLGLLRLESWDNLTGHFGIDLFNFHHVSNATSGPNARHNVFGLMYFGFGGSILFSFILGSLVGFIRNVLPILLPKNFFTMCVLSYLYIKVASALDTDPILGVSYFDNLLVVTPTVTAIVVLIYFIIVKKSKA